MTAKVIPNLSEKEAARQYRLSIAQKILDIFEADIGHPVRDREELEQWAGSLKGRAALAKHCDADGKIIPEMTRERH
jgi:hypothetical protein